jgi:hypothetical protein
MISPELIAGMIFLPSMADNEAIDIVGVERFSSYTGSVLLDSSKFQLELNTFSAYYWFVYFKCDGRFFFSRLNHL